MMEHLGSPPHAFIHGDFRLDNLFFHDDEPAKWLIVIDWQAVGFGRGPFDLSYFLTGNIPVKTLVACEKTLVRAYHDALVEAGVDDYPFETCWRDHQLSKLMLFHRLISGGGLVDLSHERGQKILAFTVSNHDRMNRYFKGIIVQTNFCFFFLALDGFLLRLSIKRFQNPCPLINSFFKIIVIQILNIFGESY